MTDHSLVFTLVFSAVLVLGLLTKFYLASRQIRHVARNRGAVPAAFAGTIPLEAHQKAADYTIAKARFGMLEWRLAPPCCWAGRCWAASMR
jgi:STE24 endopeptidase